VGIGRGTELYPLPDVKGGSAILVAPGIHVSTPAAYSALQRGELTTELLQNTIDSFQAHVWGVAEAAGINDFESAVFREHPALGVLKRKLVKLGANPAMMSGSGSAVYGIFGAKTQAERAAKLIRKDKDTVFAITLVSRARYRASWLRWLGAHRIQSEWPPRSRYSQ
jgi:4-diphosphocytidyl-2-C-methyl-D-erythritol kinase